MRSLAYPLAVLLVLVVPLAAVGLLAGVMTGIRRISRIKRVRRSGGADDGGGPAAPAR